MDYVGSAFCRKEINFMKKRMKNAINVNFYCSKSRFGQIQHSLDYEEIGKFFKSLINRKSFEVIDAKFRRKKKYYTRICRKCNSFYKTFSKKGKICQDCSTQCDLLKEKRYPNFYTAKRRLKNEN